METHILEIDGVKLICPIDFIPKINKIRVYPECCGPSSIKFIDWIVPDEFFNIKISIACDIHDYEFSLKEKSWDHFHAANQRLFRNSMEIFYKFENELKHYQKIIFIETMVKYLHAVDVFGPLHYW